MNFTKLLDNKNVLFIPIYSARSYKTGKYQLQNDGNFARVYSTIKSLQLKSATVLVPLNTESFNQHYDNSITFVTTCYGINAANTRKFMHLCDLPEDIVKAIKKNKFDYIVCEPNMLTLELSEAYADKLIYWCVASVTTEGTPWFVKEYTAVDKRIAKNIPTAVANLAQEQALKGKAFIEKSFYNPEVFDFETIYFPFRLTDDNYHAQQFISVILELAKDKSLKKFKVFYPDLNDCGNFEFLDKDIFVKVPKQHELYVQLLKSKPIIPYLENSEMLEHISIHEFLYYNVRLIMLKPKSVRKQYALQVDNDVSFIENVDELKDMLISKLRRTI